VRGALKDDRVADAVQRQFDGHGGALAFSEAFGANGSTVQLDEILTMARPRPIPP